jgi:hypothetical protein
MMGAGINSTILYANNPQIDEYCSNIYIGEVLCVANQVASPEEVEGRHVGSAGGVPAGPPAPTPYPAAKHKVKPAVVSSSSLLPVSTSAVNVAAAPSPTEVPTSTSYAAPAVATPESNDDDEDDEDLPECEDDNVY